MMRREDEPGQERPHRPSNLAVALACGALVASMVGLSYAAVPFYDWFCRATGLGGRTQVATAAPASVQDRKITVRFDTNVAGGLPWRLEPERTTIEVRIGEVATVMYSATNLAARETSGLAAYNVTPLTVGSYFQKINCFCFNEQTLKPGEKQEWPVVFFVDPSILQDAEQNDLNTITLSYTVYPVRQDRPLAQKAPVVGSGRVE